jgi:hypothetical protein
MTLFALATIILFSVLGSAPVVAPNADAQCLRSPIHLGTDNIPSSNDRLTSVVDMTAFVSPRSGRAVAWVYQNRLGQQWLQTNMEESSILRDALSPAQYARYAKGDPRLGEGSTIVRVMPRDVAVFTKSLARLRIERQRCFSGAFSNRHFDG